MRMELTYFIHLPEMHVKGKKCSGVKMSSVYPQFCLYHFLDIGRLLVSFGGQYAVLVKIG